MPKLDHRLLLTNHRKILRKTVNSQEKSKKKDY